MNRRFKVISLVFCASILVFVLTGTGMTKTTLRVSHWWADVLDPLFAEYGKYHPDIEIKLEPKPWSGYGEKLLVEIAGGTLADVSLLDAYWFPVMFKKGVFFPLAGLAKMDELDLENWSVDPRLENGYGDNFYGLSAFAISSPSLWVNMDLAREAGVEVPVLGTLDFGKWRWEDLLEAAQKLTKGDASGETIQWAMPPVNWHMLGALLTWQNEGEVVDDVYVLNETKSLIDQPEAVEAFQFLVDLTRKYKVAMPGSMDDSLFSQALFFNQKVAFRTDYVPWIQRIGQPDLDFDYDWIPWPYSKRDVVKYGGNSWVINSKTKEIEAAWSLIKWLTMADRAEPLMSQFSLVSYKPERVFLHGETNEKRIRSWRSQLTLGRSGLTLRPWWLSSENPFKVGDILQAESDLMFLEGKPVEEALKDAAAEINGTIYGQ